jgi:penicillin-insensitive murein DD-endopeptidase
MKHAIAAVLSLAFLVTGATAGEELPARKIFGNLPEPANGKPQAIGFYTKGCLAGGVALPVDGPAWQAMRLSRNRNWGHPKLVALVQRLATEAKEKDGWPGLLVGDLAQPRGGPMLTGHASHQVGLDADIWLMPSPGRTLSREEREQLSAVSVVKSRTEIDDKVWTEGHAKLLKRAASYAQVERIFVNPPIKKALCEWAKGDRSWLGKIRPWYGHTYHFHIRMGCPDGSKISSSCTCSSMRASSLAFARAAPCGSWRGG